MFGRLFVFMYIVQICFCDMLHNWLTEDEAIEVFAVLDEFYPVETPIV